MYISTWWSKPHSENYFQFIVDWIDKQWVPYLHLGSKLVRYHLIVFMRSQMEWHLWCQYFLYCNIITVIKCKNVVSHNQKKKRIMEIWHAFSVKQRGRVLFWVTDKNEAKQNSQNVDFQYWSVRCKFPACIWSWARGGLFCSLFDMASWNPSAVIVG